MHELILMIMRLLDRCAGPTWRHRHDRRLALGTVGLRKDVFGSRAFGYVEHQLVTLLLQAGLADRCSLLVGAGDNLDVLIPENVYDLLPGGHVRSRFFQALV